MVRDMIEETIEMNVPLYVADSVAPQERDYDGLIHWANAKFPTDFTRLELDGLNSDAVIEKLTERATALLDEREQAMGADKMRELERYLLLQVMDVKWKDHLHAMDQLRSGIGLRAYAQKDPQVAYKVEGYDMFQSMIESIKEEVSSLILRLQPADEYEETDVWRVSDVTHSEVQAFDAAAMTDAAEAPQTSESPKPFVREGRKVGRNDPCPCGSGKKYKKCCGANR